jgi:hypothetical protein
LGAEGLKDIRNLLAGLVEGVLSGEVSREVAIAANQLLNTSLRAIELERKWKEIEELEGRLEALENVLKRREKRQAG